MSIKLVKLMMSSDKWQQNKKEAMNYNVIVPYQLVLMKYTRCLICYFLFCCSLSLFQIIRPIPEILIIGCGRYIQPVHPELRQFVRSTGMKLEAVDSRNAASTYNILNEEGRIVAAALLPYGVSS
ncbi:hypothetical protein Ahy_B09g095521 isoform B [Arachis hypogaea]|uniref:NADH dehydrogenase [ubiquinone] 1 alpha subcomplex assembly factor 3 n=1 Tax=Arachis hypogaea TaxID=3818 RepID=A0A444XEJ2_ARAHY|nr:hypothetical protein Ahy_B09g095521 isoform B [Arachis hypogaea]